MDKCNREGIKSPIAKFLTEDELNALLPEWKRKQATFLLFVADQDDVVFASLGHLRLQLAETEPLG